MATPQTILARWRTHIPPSPALHAYNENIHVLEVLISPAKPVSLHNVVKVVIASRIAYHTPNKVAPRYDSYDPHIVGTLDAVVGETEDIVALELSNLCSKNPKRKFILLVPRNEGSIDSKVPRAEAPIPFTFAHFKLEEAEVEPLSTAIESCTGSQCTLHLHYEDPVTHFAIIGQSTSHIHRKIVPRSRRIKYEATTSSVRK